MSWFETTKCLAKTALKEAQKQIDKALDIQEEENLKNETFDIKVVAKKEAIANREKCKTEPCTPIANVDGASALPKESQSHLSTNVSSWGSFTGSFFENPNGKEMITVPPKAKIEMTASKFSDSDKSKSEKSEKRLSMTSNSDSVELLSSVSSPISELASPSVDIVQTSESVELITATSSEIVSPDSSGSLPESIVIITKEKSGDNEDDDSLSYNTVVMDDSVSIGSSDIQKHSKATSCPPKDSKDELSENDIMQSLGALGQSTSSSGTIKLIMSMEEVPYETQTVDSDSTQSFEEVLMSSSSLQGYVKATTHHCKQTNEKSDHTKVYTPNCSSSQNSNDEIETATSSDIEIISNPNGDSSSTNSAARLSPLKMKKATCTQSTAQPCGMTVKKGHCREPSEVSVLSEDSQSEVDKLLHRISDLNAVIESREMRLLESERRNAELQERHDELQAALDAIKVNNAGIELGEDYTQRLSVLEKKFQGSIRERDALRIQINSLKNELQNMIPKENLTQVMTENNTIIEELRSEGEKLSKEILLQSNIIKKLRLKEKTNDSILKKNKEQITGLTEELERLKKTLNAKEEVERSQIEAVHKMSSEKRKLEEENSQLRSRLEDMQSKLMSLQISFDAVKSELQQQQRHHSDLTRSAEESVTVKKEMETIRAANQEMCVQLTELREKLRCSEQMIVKREQQLREENRELLRRVEAAELRAESSTQEISLTTVPLVRQLEALQNTLTNRTNMWNKEEKMLLDKLDVAQCKLKSLEGVEKKYKESADLLQAQCKELEEKLCASMMQEEQTKLSLQQTQLEYGLKEREFSKKLAAVEEKLNDLQEHLQRLEEENTTLRSQLQTSVDACQQQQSNNACMENSECAIGRLSVEALSAVNRMADEPLHSHSPSNSYGKNSLEEAMGYRLDWQTDEADCISNSGHQASSLVYGVNLNLMGANTTTLEHLQSMLKQRDGEIAHQQWELSRLQSERTILTEEISNLTMELENLREKLQLKETLDSNYAELQHKYDALLQMFGEKVERCEELQLDLIELKEAYKLQIDELLAQPKNPT